MSDSLMTLLRISIPDHPMLSDNNRYLINGLINGLKSVKIRKSQFAYFGVKLAIAENWGAAKQNKIGFPTP